MRPKPRLRRRKREEKFDPLIHKDERKRSSKTGFFTIEGKQYRYFVGYAKHIDRVGYGKFGHYVPLGTLYEPRSGSPDANLILDRRAGYHNYKGALKSRKRRQKK